MRNSSPMQFGFKWVIVAVLVAVSVGLIYEVVQADPNGSQDDATQVTSKDNLIVVSGQVARDSYGLYLVDTDNKTICVYQWIPATRKMRLMASRTFVYDVRLDDYNCDSPTPREVKRLVDQQRRLGTTAPAEN